MLLQEQGTKLYVDAVLKTHERVVQVRPSSVGRMCRWVSPLLMFLNLFLQLSSLDALLCPVFLDTVLKNQPEGVKLAVKEVSSSVDSSSVITPLLYFWAELFLLAWLSFWILVFLCWNAQNQSCFRVVVLPCGFCRPTVCPVELNSVDQCQKYILKHKKVSHRTTERMKRNHIEPNHAFVKETHNNGEYPPRPPSPPRFSSQHTEADYQARFKGRPELEGLRAQMTQ